ncbi:nitrite reductase large subunit [Halieaceae bacterium IMCC14734]|uniref:Nitrite reductase large subunit n=1 Tax=Candidatus Litorirhabdus singularis TaxID=2518993 RepID=A0ABT3TEK0_9GAMM|nr:nitrite reductase large subunit NirB [Candidatus Litorirhabdus singularis]MCX2980740.1 nitrite reductase large subunit [Candidatus Litorirhabdus singularis]
MTKKPLKVVVVGNGMVGHHFTEALAHSNAVVTITVIGGETRPAYDRVHLSEVFAGKEPGELALTSREAYQAMGVKAHFGDPVSRIDREQQEVITAGGQCFAYDKLVLATGSYPFVPPIPGGDQKGCLTYRTIDDLGEIKAAAANARTGVVVGGGLLGLECANALLNLGLETHVVEFAPGLMGVQLDDGGGRMLRRKIEALGVHVHTSKATQQIVAGSEHAMAMEFADESRLETDMIVFSAGIRPYDQLAAQAGLELGERGGIVIDYNCRTSDSNILAIGECALFGGRIFGLVAPGYRMAEAAVSQFTAEKLAFQGADMSTKLKLMGVDVGSIGDAHGREPGSIAWVFSDEREEIYKRLVVNAAGDKLLGAVLVGDCSEYDSLLQYFLNGIDLPADPASLILPNVEGAPQLGAAALPASATICSCHNVSKGDIAGAFDVGCCSLGDIKGATKASTGCGGCAALLKTCVDAEMLDRGMSVNTSICEHFPYTRQELYHLIRVGDIRDFDSLLEAHGSGLGCDICKPTAASILASCWNDYILKEQHTGLQDTNDRYLANMQKNGTYSIVPRIAGGEITPAKLIVLGEVARDYDLYTKVTGGQRIDLFGARGEDLPAIWERLIASGFETGHAYAKSLRTVKSCVGSTWCRFGVSDSVAMAITIENRYKGLRSPHKLKSAVSGCTRECAEAQSKDFGVIATENGWNLYVCGNGGMKPRHADLFATDLTDTQLIQTIDRFLMFYIRTADRLQRTSVWLDNLEGGLDYLKAVILEDSLSIGAELEAEMEAVVASYQCEWRTTVEDGEKSGRFAHFVNSEQGDSNIVFVSERDQPRPATAAERDGDKTDILATG